MTAPDAQPTAPSSGRPWFASPAEAVERLGDGRLPRRPGDRDHGVPRRRAREAAARRGPRRRRQDRAGQGGRRARPAPSWSGCSATRGSTRRARSTSGTTRSSCCASRPRRATTSRGSETHDDIFTEEFLLTRPLLTAIRRDEPTVLLIDEVDKTDVEVEGAAARGAVATSR